MITKLTSLLASAALAFSMSAFAEKSEMMDKVNVNTATIQELDDNLAGVGKKTAEEIVRYRKENGAFKSMEDLDKVKYVGARLIEKNKEKIVFE